jgi:hypothetical protein
MGVTTRTGTANLTTWGPLISCWDCHAPNAATGLQTASVTAHGGAVTLRQSVWVKSTVNNGAVGAGNLCRVCHVVAASGSTHGAGSAWLTTGNGTPGGYARDECFRCHSSAVTKPARPIPAQDAHGFDAFATAGDLKWPVGTTETYRPYAFMRNVGTGNTWNASGNYWKPLSALDVTAGAAICSGNCGRASHGTYTPGGIY